MLRLLALAAHFSPFNPGPFDPEVVNLLNGYFDTETASNAQEDSVSLREPLPSKEAVDQAA